MVLPFALRGGCLAGKKTQKVNREIPWKLPYRLFILLRRTGVFEKQFSFSFRSITLLFTKIALETRVYQQQVLIGGCQHPKRGIFSWLGRSGFWGYNFPHKFWGEEEGSPQESGGKERELRLFSTVSTDIPRIPWTGTKLLTGTFMGFRSSKLGYIHKFIHFYIIAYVLKQWLLPTLLFGSERLTTARPSFPEAADFPCNFHCSGLAQISALKSISSPIKQLENNRTEWPIKSPSVSHPCHLLTESPRANHFPNPFLFPILPCSDQQLPGTGTLDVRGEQV